MKKLLSVLSFAFVALLSHAGDTTELWNWTTPGQNGGLDRIYNLRLKVQGSQISGTILSPNRTNDTFTEFTIKDGSLENGNIAFAVERSNRRSTNVSVTKYVGKLSGDNIEGTIDSPGRGGKRVTTPWKAERNTTGQLVTGTRIVVKPGYNEAGHKIVNETKFKELTPDDTEKYLAAHPDAIILDTRAPDEYAEVHIPNSKNYDLTNEANYKNVLSTLDKTKRYVVLSASGGYRTIRALEYFEANGFAEAVALDGGINAWQQAGKPIAK